MRLARGLAALFLAPALFPACLRLNVTMPGRSHAAPAEAPAPADIDAGGGFVAERAFVVALGGAKGDLVAAGRLVNRSGKDWRAARFEARALDGEGKALGVARFGVGPIEDGVTALLGGEKGLAIPRAAEGAPASLALTFLGGEPVREPRFTLVSPKAGASREGEGFAFRDARIDLVLVPDRRGVTFLLKNRSRAPITLHWDRMTLVTPAGESVRVVHQGVRYADRNLPQPPLTVVPGTVVKDTLIPAASIRIEPGAGWRVAPFLPSAGESGAREPVTFGLYLPIETPSGRRDYRFTFQSDLVGPRSALDGIIRKVGPRSVGDLRAAP